MCTHKTRKWKWKLNFDRISKQWIANVNARNAKMKMKMKFRPNFVTKPDRARQNRKYHDELLIMRNKAEVFSIDHVACCAYLVGCRFLAFSLFHKFKSNGSLVSLSGINKNAPLLDCTEGKKKQTVTRFLRCEPFLNSVETVEGNRQSIRLRLNRKYRSGFCAWLEKATSRRVENVKGAATTATARRGAAVRMLPLERFHRAIHPAVHPFHSSPSHFRIHRVYLLAFLTRCSFRRSCPDASFFSFPVDNPLRTAPLRQLFAVPRTDFR